MRDAEAQVDVSDAQVDQAKATLASQPNWTWAIPPFSRR